MKLKKIFSGLLVIAAFTAPLLSEGREQPTQEELAIREKVIKDIVAESYGQDPFAGQYSYQGPRRIIVRARIEGPRIRMEKSNESQLAREINLKNLAPGEQNGFINTRNMALAGISAGGILYFFPNQKIFFWETDDANLPEGSIRDGILMNPMIGGILSGVLASAQRDLKNSDYKVMGSKKLGAMMMLILNPAEALVQNTNQVTGRKVFTGGTTEITTESPQKPYQPTTYSDRPTNYIGLQFQIRF